MRSIRPAFLSRPGDRGDAAIGRAPIRSMVRWLLAGVVLAIGLDDIPALDPSRRITQYVHDVWQRDDGLPQNTVKDILQTRDGYLWLATQEGLARFDGARFVVFNTRNAATLPDDNIWTLGEDADGTLWIGTPGGLVRMQDGILATFTSQEGLPANHVRSIHRDRKGTLWIANAGELSVFEGGGARVYRDRDGRTLKGGYSFVETADGSLWIAADRLYRLRDDRLTAYGEAQGLPARPSALVTGADDTLWVGTFGAGLARFDGSRFTLLTAKDGLPGDLIYALLTDRDGNLWIGTNGGGLARYRDGKLQTLSDERARLTNDVMSLFEDAEGSLWVGTNGGGLHRFKDGDFTTFGPPEGLAVPTASCLLQATDGDLWIGTSGGVFRLHDGKFDRYTKSDGLAGDAVFSLAEGDGGGIWIGTGDGGLSLRDRRGHFRTFTKAHGLTGRFVVSLSPDRGGALWVGTDLGLSRFAGGRFVPSPGLFGGRSFLVGALLRDSRGDLWIGTHGGGLLRLHDGTSTTFTTREGLSSDRILALREDRDGTIWIGTQGGGLDRLRDGAFTSYTTRAGLCSDTIFQVLEDDRGSLWMSSNDGIFRVPKDLLAAFAEKKTVTIDCVLYGRSDGIRSSECNGGSQPAGWKGRDGRLWFPTAGGAVVVDPARIHGSPRPPGVVVEEFEADGLRLDRPRGKGPVVVPAGTGRFEIRYTALTFRSPETVRFRYRLEGLDGDWVEAGTRRTAYYAHLAPGDHRFRVTARSGDGSWGDAEAVLAFRLLPYIYQTTWFYGACILVAVLITGGGYRLRIHQVRARERELERVVRDRTRELSAAKGALEESNRTLEQRVEHATRVIKEKERMAAYGLMVASVAHEVRHPIFALQAASYLLRTDPKDGARLAPQVDIIEREIGRMAALMDDLLEFARPAALVPAPADPGSLLKQAVETYRAEHGDDAVEIVVCVGDDLPAVVMDRDRILQVLVNLMDNAQKHARGLRKVTLSARAENASSEPDRSRVRLDVVNDGAGIPAESLPHLFEPFYTTGRGSGLGLAIVRRIITDHAGTIEVESRPEGGTTFTILLPVAGPAPADHANFAARSAAGDGGRKT